MKQTLIAALLCALGTWVYSGLDGTWRMIPASVTGGAGSTQITDSPAAHAATSHPG